MLPALPTFSIALRLSSISAIIYLCVVSILECPNHMAIVDMSTPDINKFIATECRNVCGVIVFSRRFGT